MNDKIKNILIVDDSALMRRLISDIIISDNRLTVKDMAVNGLEALDLIVKNPYSYDAVILDINMPKMNGLELLEQLQKLRLRMVVLVVSTVAKEGAKETILALERGAFDFVTKPENYFDAKEAGFKETLLALLCTAIRLEYPEPDIHKSMKPIDKPYVNYVHRPITNPVLNTTEHIKKPGTFQVKPPKGVVFKEKKRFYGSKEGKNKIVALACSTGGPKSLQEVIPMLPNNLDAPVVLVQHMPKGFTYTLAARLNEVSKLKVKEASQGDILQKGWVYIAPGGSQMRIENERRGISRVVLTDEPARDGLRPCANIMYESLMESDYDEITCVVLTGMGADGTMGIGQLGEKNNIYVIAQDETTSVVYGMPKAVAEAKLVDEIVPLNKIADAISKNVGVLNNGR